MFTIIIVLIMASEVIPQLKYNFLSLKQIWKGQPVFFWNVHIHFFTYSQQSIFFISGK